MAILSVDLALRRWADLGIVAMGRGPTPTAPIVCEIIAWDEPGPVPGPVSAPVEAEILAGRLNHLCGARNIRILMLDGPQAWKSGRNGLEHARLSEQQLNTAAKMGLPGIVKPATYRAFAEFCVDVYDALCRRGWKRLAACDRPQGAQERILVESYPYAAWKALGIKGLPSKRRCGVYDLAENFAALKAAMPLKVNRPPNHDQLQAIVGGLAGLALEAGDPVGARLVGATPRREDGHWREGFIVLPELPWQHLMVVGSGCKAELRQAPSGRVFLTD